jgi:hypothetical protein
MRPGLGLPALLPVCRPPWLWRRSSGTQRCRRRSGCQAILIDVDLDVLAVVTVCLGEQDGQAAMPGRAGMVEVVEVLDPTPVTGPRIVM